MSLIIFLGAASSRFQEIWRDKELERWFHLGLHWFSDQDWFSDEEPDNLAYMAQQEHAGEPT